MKVYQSFVGWFRTVFLAFSLSVFVILCAPLLAYAKAGFQPAVMYDMGTKFDKSYNESVYRGLEKFKAETGIDFWEYNLTSEVQREQYLRHMSKKGADIVFVVGFASIPVLEKVAPDFPHVKYVMIDSDLDLPNVLAVSFKEHEGSYLVGALAALKSKTKKLGFVGGVDVPLVRRFSCAYIQGARETDPNVEILVNMVGDTPSAWRDPVKAGEITKSQIDRNADIVFTASGVSAAGVFSTVADHENIYAIGADSNQNYIEPGKILTSMVKNMDAFTYQALKAAQNGEWKAGIEVLGLKEHGVEWAYDEYNKVLIPADIKHKINAMRDDIINGKIKVVDYMENNSCNLGE